MSAYATCKFPLVDQWKNAADKNKGLDFIDSILSGYAQIVLSDNPFTGALFIAACFISSAQVGVSSLFTVIVALLTAKIMGVPNILLRLGLYTFSPALGGIGVAVLIFPGQGITLQMLLYAAVAGIFCVILTAGLSAFFSKFGVPAFSLPFCLVLMIMIPLSLSSTNLSATTPILPYLNQFVDPGAAGTWTVSEYFTAVINNFAEVLFQANYLTGILIIAGLLISSRVDTMSAIIASCVATLFAIALGFPKDMIMAGMCGYNAIFLMVTLFGRGYAMSVKNFIFSITLACITVLLVGGLGALFAPWGVPVAAFPFALVAITALLCRDLFTSLTFVEPAKWGVPETIAKMLKEENDAQSASKQNTGKEEQ